eukprot:7699551-Alexandrium_andersonii.AAC.1
MARGLSAAFAGRAPWRVWLSRSHRAVPPIAESPRPAWKSPASQQMSSQPRLTSSENSARSRGAASARRT